MSPGPQQGSPYVVCRTRVGLKKEGNPAVCGNVDEPGGIALSEVVQTRKDKPRMLPLTRGIEEVNLPEATFLLKNTRWLRMCV